MRRRFRRSCRATRGACCRRRDSRESAEIPRGMRWRERWSPMSSSGWVGGSGTRRRFALRAAGLIVFFAIPTRAEDGYRLWLRYDRIDDESLRRTYSERTRHISLQTPSGSESPTLVAAREELRTALEGMLGFAPTIETKSTDRVPALGDEGYSFKTTAHALEIKANSDVGVLYGAFALLRHLQTCQPLERLDVSDTLKISRRLLNHWDNLNGTIERGY